MSESPNYIELKKTDKVKRVKKLIIINDATKKTNGICLDNNKCADNKCADNKCAVNNAIMNTLLEKYSLLHEKYTLLEEKMTEMGKLISTGGGHYGDASGKRHKEKRQTLEILSCSYPFRTNNFSEFNDFVSAEFNHRHLKILFNNKFDEGYIFILTDLLNMYNQKYNFNIVRAFNEESNHLYIFSGCDLNAPRWTIWTNTSMMDTVNRIYKKVISEFAKWQNEILNKMKDDDDLAIEYSTQLKKVFVNPASKDNFCGLISKKLYKSLKMDLF